MMTMLAVMSMILMRMISIRGKKKYVLAIQILSLVVFSSSNLQGDTD